MARSGTTVVKGQQLALKHGAYSASSRLAKQNQTLELARQQLQAKRITPLALQVYRTLNQTIKRQKQVSLWLNRLGNPSNPITAKGERLKDWITLEAVLQKSVHLQTIALWKMLLAAPAEQQLDVDDVRSHFRKYATRDAGSPDVAQPTLAEAQAPMPVSGPADLPPPIA